MHEDELGLEARPVWPIAVDLQAHGGPAEAGDPEVEIQFVAESARLQEIDLETGGSSTSANQSSTKSLSISQ
jgi:hypothetical protein